MRTYGYSVLPYQDTTVQILMPYYTADTQHSLERGSRPYSVVEILREVFKEDFHKAIQSYIDECPAGTRKAIGKEDSYHHNLVWLSEPKVESSLHQPACTTAVDLVFKATIEALVPADGEIVLQKQQFPAAFRMRYLLKLWEKKCSAPTIAPVDYFPSDFITEQKTQITNQYLLPIMYAKDYGIMAGKMLKSFYQEALEGTVAVDGKLLAERMNLTIREVRFERGSDIQGRIYFDWTWVSLRNPDGSVSREKIPPMTILINLDLCPTPEIKNSTIVHECCHVYLDLPFFKLQMMSGKPFTSYTSRKKTKKRYGGNNTAIDWMELQAEKLPAYILMEENNTRKEIERLLSLRGGNRSHENMYWVMCQLAGIFKVSRSMAKYRMIELGYPEAEGVYAFIDRQRIPDYGCSGTWRRGITYAISLSDAGALLYDSAEFAEALGSGCYTYVEGHFCLDRAPYIEYDYRQMKRLSAYARRCIDECCIAFSVNGRYANTSYEDAQAARKTPVKDKYRSRHSFDAEPETREREKQNQLMAQDSQLWMDVKMNIKDNLGETLQYILNLKGVTQEELSMRMGVSRTAYRKWCSERMSMRHIVAICIALDVRADIGDALVKLAGHPFRNNDEYKLLYGFLFETEELTVARANEIMRQKKLPPLTDGQDGELAC